MVPGAGTGQLGRVGARLPCYLPCNELLPGWEALGCSCTPVGSAQFGDTGLRCARRVGGKGKGGLRWSSEGCLGCLVAEGTGLVAEGSPAALEGTAASLHGPKHGSAQRKQEAFSIGFS